MPHQPLAPPPSLRRERLYCQEMEEELERHWDLLQAVYKVGWVRPAVPDARRAAATRMGECTRGLARRVVVQASSDCCSLLPALRTGGGCGVCASSKDEARC